MRNAECGNRGTFSGGACSAFGSTAAGLNFLDTDVYVQSEKSQEQIVAEIGSVLHLA